MKGWKSSVGKPISRSVVMNMIVMIVRLELGAWRAIRLPIELLGGQKPSVAFEGGPVVHSRSEVFIFR